MLSFSVWFLLVLHLVSAFLNLFFQLCVCVREKETEREGRRGELVDNYLRKCLFLYLNYAVLVVNIYYLSKLSVACNF